MTNADVTIDGAILSELLHIPLNDMPALMRAGLITSRCERGVDEHQGEYRLSFFYGNRRVRLSIDAKGEITRRSVIDFGDRPLPPKLRLA